MPERKALFSLTIMERVRGIEPPYSAWEADVLPLNYTRIGCIIPRFVRLDKSAYRKEMLHKFDIRLFCKLPKQYYPIDGKFPAVNIF